MSRYRISVQDLKNNYIYELGYFENIDIDNFKGVDVDEKGFLQDSGKHKCVITLWTGAENPDEITKEIEKGNHGK